MRTGSLASRRQNRRLTVAGAAQLVSADGRMQFINRAYDGPMEEHVTVYIDPAPTDAGSSLHAISVVGNAGHLLVLLAVEEFTTRAADPDTLDPVQAMARVFVNTMAVLNILHGEITTVCVALKPIPGLCQGSGQSVKN